MMGEIETVRMQTPPMMFWGIIANEQWGNMTDSDKDKVIEAAKVIHPIFDYSKLFK